MRKIFIPTIGSKVKVVWASNPSLIGVEGVILEDTKNTLVIKGKSGAILRIGKKGCLFEIRIDNKTIKVAGEELMGDYVRRLSKI